MLREVSPKLSPPKYFTSPFPYASFWICRPLNKAGRRLQGSDGRDVGIVVVFVRESDVERAHDRKFDDHGNSKNSARMRYIPPGAQSINPAVVALAKTMMERSDVDGVPPAEGWTIKYLNPSMPLSLFSLAVLSASEPLAELRLTLFLSFAFRSDPALHSRSRSSRMDSMHCSDAVDGDVHPA